MIVSSLSPRDRAVTVLAVALLLAILIAAIVSVAAGACCLAPLRGKKFNHFPLLFGLGGVAPVALGGVGLLLALLLLFFHFFSSFFFSSSSSSSSSFCFLVSSTPPAAAASCGEGQSRRRWEKKHTFFSCFSSFCGVFWRVCLCGLLPLLLLVLLLALSLLGFTAYGLSRQLQLLPLQLLPIGEGYTALPGASGPIEIVRDENGLTHIKASSRRDAYLGQGFAEAQDRLFQLEFHRTVAKGELASLVGKDGVQTDKSIRTINVRDAAYAMCNLTDPAQLDLFQAFADGVNLYLQRVSKRPVEFFFMSTRPLYFHNPKPFSAVDLCLTARLYQWQMSSNVDAEGQRFAVWAGTNRTYNEVEELYQNFTDQPNPILNQAQMVQLLVSTGAITGENGAAPTQSEIAVALETNAATEATSNAYEAAVYDNILSIVRSQLVQSASGAKAAPAASRVHSPQAVIEGHVHRVMADRFYARDGDDEKTVFPYKFMHASNAWAARTADGKAVVASDPHLTINSPSVWYYTHLSFPDENGVQFDTAGVALVGLSGVHIGKTTYLAWGITMSKNDVQDLFILPPPQFSGLPARTYRYGGVNRVFVARSERIKVKGKKDIVLDLDDTLLGPVVSTMLGFPAALTVTLRATPLLHDDSTSVKSLLGWSDPAVNTAEKFMNNLLDLQAPGFSIPIADVHGNLAYAVTGRHPLRNMAHTGKYPTPGFDALALLKVLRDAASEAAAAGQPLDMQAVLAKVPGLLAQSDWRTYAAVEDGGSDLRVPKEGNPHFLLPFDSTAAHISCANQKATPMGYPYFLGADYAWPWRGARVQQMLDDHADRMADVHFHMDLQRDYRSNYWNLTMRSVVDRADFLRALADDKSAADWAHRLLYKWDGFAPIGSVETAFLWRWIEKMTAFPRDAVAASRKPAWDIINGYIERMLTNPSPRMLAECADIMGVPVSNTVCLGLAAKLFKEVSHEGDKRWGIDLNHLRGVHEMLDKSFLAPLFRREMEKAGDRTSVGVSDHTYVGDMLSTKAACVRQVFDLWNDTSTVHFSLPGGNSGNPYSKYFENLWNIFEKDAYITPKVTAAFWDGITLQA